MSCNEKSVSVNGNVMYGKLQHHAQTALQQGVRWAAVLLLPLHFRIQFLSSLTTCRTDLNHPLIRWFQFPASREGAFLVMTDHVYL